ncbi:MAG: PAS domain S-box protein, partial [Rubrobacter sp.]|nr:PAS domain S-box protein [Rubrobacter sp.]
MPERSDRGSLSGHRQNGTWLREQALAASRDAIIITDPTLPDNPIVYANPPFEHVTGYSVEEAVGKNCRFLQSEDRDQPALEELRAAIREGRECRVVLRNYKKDGTLFWNELSISPVHDEEGNLVNFVGVLDDVTERKRMEEALKRQAHQVALRADVAAALSSGDTLSGVLQRCAEAMVQHLDAAFARIWTLNEEEDVLELQASAGMYTHIDGPHSRVPVGELKIGLIAQERLPHLSNTVTSDPRVGDKEWARREGMVAFAGYPLIVEDRLVGVMAMFARQAFAEDTIDALESVATAVAQGIERKRAEEARARLAAIIGSSDDAIIGKTLDGVITSWNKGAQKIYGYSAEEIVGKQISVLAPLDRSNEIPDILEKVRRGELIDHYETVRLKKDGERINVSITVSPITDSVGNVVGASTIARDITERKRAEEAVEQSELLYRTVIEQATENIFLVEVEARRIMESNPAFHRTLGYKEEELRSLTLYDIVAADQESIDMDIRRSVEQRRLFIGERKYRRKDGSLVDVEVSASIIFRNGRETLCVVAHDVTEHKQAEQALRESEERFRGTFEQATVGIAHVAIDGHWLWVNPRLCDIVGYEKEELLGLSFQDITHPDDLETDREGTRRLLTGEIETYSREKRYFRKDGSTVWIYLTVSLMRSPSCEPRYFISVTEDITERKRAEEVRARLAAIVESSEDAIIGKTLEGTITNWNRGAQKIYGYSAEEVVGKPINILAPPDRPDEIPKILQRLRRGETIEHYETVRMTKDGRRLHISLRISPIRDWSGNIVGASAIARDITERKRAQEALKQSELLYRTVIEQATENIFLVEAETRRIMESNPAFQETLGYTEEELRSLTLYDIVAADRKIIDRNIRRVLGQKHRFMGERKYRRKDGSLVDVEVSVSIIFRNGRETLCIVAHDVTERKRTEEAQRFLAEAGATLASSLDYRSTLASVARLAVPRLGDWCAVDIVEEDGSLSRLAVEHEDPQKVKLAHKLQERYPPDPEVPQGVIRVVRSGQSEFYPDITDEMLVAGARDAEHLRLIRELGFISVIIVPLVARGRTLGAITLVSAESGRRYGRPELELAEELARRAALAVDNARLYRGRAQVASTLQEGLLPPRLPEVPGVEVGLRYVSAGEVDVGGDFYDLFEERSADQNGSSKASPSWGVVIGDVSGKGAEAAAVLALARYTIRAVARQESHPSGVLADLNEAMLRQRHEHENYKFCTVTYVRLKTNEGDTKQGAKVTVCRGGHSAPVLLKADGSIYKIGQPGRALGVCDDANLTEQEAQLAPGDALVLYTDGVIEARSPDGLFFGEERLMALLRSSVALDASTIADRIE